MWVVASDYRVVFSEDIREFCAGQAVDVPRRLQIHDVISELVQGEGRLGRIEAVASDASGAAPAAAAGVLSRVDTQPTEIEGTAFTVSEVPRPENRSNVTVEASYFVGLREQCRAV